ncbi:hypothetical protein K388_02693 [Streptomyces sp. KhCrAH-43]|uniref:hypothetical protein n=1 Tax=unclassified Streptomyces TaxID=2593676 RepID=UPI0003792A8B|nr:MULTISPECIES: hypothetical protein [unclassified Streptomyces]MYS36684.1 hypothetical protein [Streptomyces sp. SID4920]MYX69155.1 hypothetical protein [Streptomyces sp. SID8373]RAJ62007.1 hypothetical protein K388_02693 [Streptomyces sp. KhCrAH-43]
MTESTLPESLLLLAADFTRHNDSLSMLNGTSPSNLLTDQTALTQNLAKSALRAREVLAACPIYRSTAVRDVDARIRQLAHLAANAAQLLIDAVDIMVAAGDGAPIDRRSFLDFKHSAETAQRVDMAKGLTRLGPQDAVAAAEMFVAQSRLKGTPPPYRPLSLSSTQSRALLAVARGEVTVRMGRPCLRDGQVAATTLRSLETGGLVFREPSALPVHDERLQLTRDGRHGLIAGFGRPQRLAPSRPASRQAMRPTRNRSV